MLLTGKWYLKDLRDQKIGFKNNGLRVFSCFHCGGGSSMGYKLAGFNVVGGVEIDPEMMKLYRKNIVPEYGYSFEMPIQDFKNLKNEDLPSDLYDIDILDGSPPCSSFSMSGSREDAWGEEKQFREGQAKQVLDDLFFHFIDVAKKLKPKVILAENVKGLISGNAKGYVKQILQEYDAAGYDTQLFLFNSKFMGVPQSRQRVFFVSRRKDLNLNPIDMVFNEPIIPFKTIDEGALDDSYDLKLTPTAEKYWSKCLPGKSFSSVHEKGSFFNWVKVSPFNPLPTIAATNGHLIFHPYIKRKISDNEVVNGQTFPMDYDFMGIDKRYVCGMSVPPFMMQRIARRVYTTWFQK